MGGSDEVAQGQTALSHPHGAVPGGNVGVVLAHVVGVAGVGQGSVGQAADIAAWFLRVEERVGG